jgi:hypothetical protein
MIPKKLSLLIVMSSVWLSSLYAQNISVKPLHYSPYHSTGFVCQQPKLRFNRALYGGNTAFRVETGDLPEFALYLPGMGGNLKIGFMNGEKSKWITQTDQLKTIYQHGKMWYELQDKMLGNAVLKLEVSAAYTHEAMLIHYYTEGKVPEGIKIVFLFGGVTGKKFSRDGDIGADPESNFYLKAENCINNVWQIKSDYARLTYLSKDTTQCLSVILSERFEKFITDASVQETPLMAQKATNDIVKNPCLWAIGTLSEKPEFCWIQRNDAGKMHYSDLQKLAIENDILRQKIIQTIEIHTPDSLLNPLGEALSLAADAIWDAPTYMHGAVAWRMRLPAWRGPYIADVLGQHDRAQTHFSAYAASQVGSDYLLTSSMPDTAMHFARQVEKIGQGIFTEGYICRNPNGEFKAHHYDMNLVYIDQLINHLYWTGDKVYLQKMFPVLEKHLAWEKHNFDADNDGLFDAYCCIWASDALQYSGGAVTHSTAYNYKAFKAAAYFARLLGKNPKDYEAGARKIYNALQKHLWVSDKNCFAEYKDAMGLRLVHPSAALWTVYHAIDSKAASPLQCYQMTQYIDREIPKVPFQIPEWNQNLTLLSTNNWQPYTWSINNVALAENLHTALACWQANNADLGFTIWRNALIESFYTSASPGGFEQLSSLDAMRGELYRDFADGIGIAGRSLVEGLFGIEPDLFEQKLTIKPGFPTDWDFARLKTADLTFDFQRKNKHYHYRIDTYWEKPVSLTLTLPVVSPQIKNVKLNGKNITFDLIKLPSGQKTIQIITPQSRSFIVDFDMDDKKSVKQDFTYKARSVTASINLEKHENVASIDISAYFNDKITNIFSHQYLTPRPTSPTLQLPYQGIGNWCYPLTTALIDDRGLRKTSQQNAGKIAYNGISFSTPSDSSQNNIAFVSKWDNFPDTLTIPVKGVKGKQLHLILAGTTNPMQSRMENGKVVVHYENGKTTTLSLTNPDTWWTIEQDYFFDNKAFYYNSATKPVRLALKTGEFYTEKKNYTTIKGFSNRAVEGGAANIYSLKIENNPIQSIEIIALCNDVVIGLMAASIE